ncbi:hypothetical protein [Planctomyces sp. SH-PL62]|uniref:hypothetical protein n=1 Tax=Planctomyces sp. SH-PL62 TaxID=1636152 RepID=UPI00078C0596|nr:hypothetical protein [Planctomyces sp. SH-PL62]AMV36807.1 hypothetical protein VT85_05205 [Planctomyces sp. SH-PL62]
MIRIQELIRHCAILAALPAALSLASGRAQEPTAAATATPRAAAAADLTPLADGPLHEAFLSPRRDQAPPLVTRSPLPPVVERPAVEAPNGEARWIGGYWDWDSSRDDFVWVTGTWRVPPPGRFWVNGFWKREEDGWRRTPGFWSDRATDRFAYRKEGPPADRPLDDPGPPPKPNCFYIPGDYVPDGDRLAWRKGFWADAKLGWSWVPSSWTRQPEGWIFQEGYWDRPLEDRGILFAPASLAGEAREGDVLAYRPYTIVSPALYGQLYGAFGRSTSCYDGYPGVSYDGSGRYFAYADYGALPPYYGYLDYPAYGWRGNPYYASPLYYPSPYSAGLPVALANGLGVPYYGFGGSLLPIMMGYPIFGNLGLIGGGWGWGYPGWGMGGYGWGNSGWSGMALGTWPGFNWGTFGWSGPAIGAFPAFGINLGFPNWTSGWGGFGWGGFGWGGFGLGPNWGASAGVSLAAPGGDSSALGGPMPVPDQRSTSPPAAKPQRPAPRGGDRPDSRRRGGSARFTGGDASGTRGPVGARAGRYAWHRRGSAASVHATVRFAHRPR